MGDLDTSRWKCQSTDPVSFTSETSCLCTRKARSMASSALWGKLRPSPLSPTGAVHMEEMARLLTVPVQHWCAFFHLNVFTTGGAGLTHASLWPRPVRAAALQEIARKCNRNAKRRYKGKYLLHGPQFQVPPGDTEGIYRDGTDWVIMDLMAGYLEFGEQVVIHLHASHSSLPLQHSGKQPSRLLN